MKRNLIRTALLAGMLASLGVSAQNLVQAPDFDNTPISPPWIANGATIAFDGNRSAVGAPGSGSVQVLNTIANGFTESAFQCIDQPIASGPHDFGGWVLFPGGQSASAAVAIGLYSGAGCTGNSVGFLNTYTLDAPTWTLLTGVIAVPANVLSARIDVRIDTPVGSTPPVQAWFDGIRFGPSPTLPVELQSFSVD
jgi:hypothetical protein